VEYAELRRLLYDRRPHPRSTSVICSHQSARSMSTPLTRVVLGRSPWQRMQVRTIQNNRCAQVRESRRRDTPSDRLEEDHRQRGCTWRNQQDHTEHHRQDAADDQPELVADCRRTRIAATISSTPVTMAQKANDVQQNQRRGARRCPSATLQDDPRSGHGVGPGDRAPLARALEAGEDAECL